MTGPAATASPTSPWHTQGHLETTPSSSISYEHVAQHPRTVFDRQHVIKLAFDRSRISEHLKPWLLDACFSEQLIKEKFVGFVQGFKDMSPA